MSLYGKAVAGAAMADILYMAAFNVHHNDPMMYGGDKKQPYQTIMTEADHKALHKAMRKFMRAINKKLISGRGRDGQAIQNMFGRKFLLKNWQSFINLM